MIIGIIFILAVVAILLITGVLSLGKTELTFVTPSVEALYDGMALTNHKWEMSEGSLKEGHELKITFKGSQTVVGESENAIEVKIIDELGADVTGDYNINYDFGTLKVNPRSLVITSASASKAYDGKPLVASKYKISEDCDGLVIGHRESVVVTGFIIEPGKTNNTVYSSYVYDENGNDVTRNYKLIIREGLLVVEGEGGAVTPPDGPINPDGPIDPSTGEVIPDDVLLFSVLSDKSGTVYLKTQSFGLYNGKDWDEAYPYILQIPIEPYGSASYLPGLAIKEAGHNSSNIQIKSYFGLYALPYYMGLSGEGNQLNDILYSSDNNELYSVSYYDYAADAVLPSGKVSNYENQYRRFVYDHYLHIDSETKQYMNKIISDNGFDANDPEIISKVASYIQNAAVYNLKYDPALDNEPNVALAFLGEYKEGVCRHYATAATLLFRTLGIPARYTVGFSARTEANKWSDVKADRAHAWVEVYVNGFGWMYVEVTGSSANNSNDFSDEPAIKPVLSVKPATVRKKYDGTVLKATSKIDGNDMFKEYMKKGYTYEAVVTGSRVEAGITQSEIVSIIIRDPSGNDVTDSFNMLLGYGTVQVYLDIIHFESNSYKKTYDGKQVPLNVINDSKFGSDYTITYSHTADLNVGTHLNTFNVNICNENGDDVTDQYWAIKTYGEITISPLEITVKAGDAEKVYDGTPLTCEEISIEVGELAEGHTIKFYTVVGSQTSAGRSENVITYILICDAEGKNVTSNYSIKLISGQLKVKIR